MSGPRVPEAAVRVAADVIDRTSTGSPYIALDVVTALADAGWLMHPQRRDGVARLHRRRELEGRSVCLTCRFTPDWPCATYRALGGPLDVASDERDPDGLDSPDQARLASGLAHGEEHPS